MSQRHHRHSIRLPGYDYTQPGAYFITICSHDRREIFGEIIAAEMQLNSCGRIAGREWKRLPTRFPSLTRRVPTTDTTRCAPTPAGEQFGRPVPGSIPTIIRSYKSSVSLQINRLRVGARRHAKRDQILPQSAVPLLDHPVWQRNYYEHVIRSDGQHQRLHDYILENPQRWAEDAESPVRRLK